MTAFDVNFGPRPLIVRWASALLWRIEHAFERARAEGRAEDAKLRIFFVAVIFAAGFLTLGVGATRIAVFSDEAASADLTVAAVQSARADLVDRNGNLLAVDLPYYALFVDSREIWDSEETRRRLGAILEPAARARLEKALAAKKRMQIVTPLSAEAKAKIADMGLPGVSFEPEARRNYPLGATAAHLLGFAGAGGVGRSGVELALDKQIHAQAGRGPLALSLDLRVQAALEDEVKRAAIEHNVIGAVGLVTNIQTGEVLGMVSYPDFDPNDTAKTPLSNTLNRSAASVFEMGSIFKVFSFSAGLDSGSARLTSTFDVSQPLQFGGQFIHDHDRINGVLTLPEVFQHSSNIGTAKMALQMGGETMTRYLRNYGLFAAAPIELAESASPFPRHLFQPGYKWQDVSVATTSYGHGMAVSPLSVAAAMGGVMNGGTLLPLTVLKVDPQHPPQGRRIISEQTSRTMLDLMRLNAVHGTGSKAEAEAPGLRVGGKTGTAEKAINGRYDRSKQVSSFAAVFPTDGPLNGPRYFVLVLLDEPRGGVTTGGMVSAPPAGRVINRIAPFLGVKRAAAPAAGVVADPAVEKLIAEEQ
jgi:cell division protein FtsI (penicillin-binding protein 3)